VLTTKRLRISYLAKTRIGCFADRPVIRIELGFQEKECCDEAGHASDLSNLGPQRGWLRRAYRGPGGVGCSVVELGGVLLLTLQQLIQLRSALSLTYLVQVCVSHRVVVADTKLKYVLLDFPLFPSANPLFFPVAHAVRS
jgi:hypothetical protein